MEDRAFFFTEGFLTGTFFVVGLLPVKRYWRCLLGSLSTRPSATSDAIRNAGVFTDLPLNRACREMLVNVSRLSREALISFHEIHSLEKNPPPELEVMEI